MAKAQARKQNRRCIPRWDEQLHELWYDGVLVHRFRRVAATAELILEAFEELDWPHRIDDPLPPLKGRREPMRLRKEIYALNHRLQNRRIRFRMDGSGTGILWEPVDAATAPFA